MSGRRSHQRFTIATATEGTLRVLRDVLVERATRDEVVVLGRHAGIVGERLRMELSESPEGVREVRVTDSRPVVAEGAVRHRLTLKSLDTREDSQAAPGESTLAVLTRELPVRVLNCSSSGCLLESIGRVDVGTVASLRLMVEEEELLDLLQVVRFQPIEGGSSYHAGAEFLWTVAPTVQSLRVGIGRRALAGGW